MSKSLVVLKNRYFDSIFLMRIAHQIAGLPGIRDASVLMATEANRRLLAELGYGSGGLGEELASAGPNDLVIAIEGEETAVEAVAADPDRWLYREAAPGTGAGMVPRSLDDALALRPDAAVAAISVPGEYAAREARSAISRGLNVFLFSSNVSVEDEMELKTRAREKGLIVMGPDCGTAYLCGAGIGFANAVRRGAIGIVASSGTGMQEFASLVHQAGLGISHGIGTGSRDLSDAIGGSSTLTAIEALEADPATRVIALLSKPPGPGTMTKVMERLAACRKPVVMCLLGARAEDTNLKPGSQARFASSIDAAVAFAIEAAGGKAPARLRVDLAGLNALAAEEVARMQPAQKWIRGIFAGGSFCYQSQAIIREAGIEVYSNAPASGIRALSDPRMSLEHSLVDMGAEIFVEGRPHPMIDARLRRERVIREGGDPGIALLLLDFILGAVSSDDPVGDLLQAIETAQAAARERGGHLCVAASVCGTDQDAQGLEEQEGKLREAGVLVFPSSAQAALFSRELALLLVPRKRGR
jgi:FdrA protein